MSILSPARVATRRIKRAVSGRLGALMFQAISPTFRKTSWHYTLRRKAYLDPATCLQDLVVSDNITAETIQHYFQELAQSKLLRETVDKYSKVTGKGFEAQLSGVAVAGNLFCYVMTRIVKPNVIVETGCAAGGTTSLFLLALHHNEKGHLYSIDLPPVAGELSMNWSMPEDMQPGYLVPDELRGRWTLIRGNARTELIPLLERVKPVDLFCHDSDHTYEHMMWEYASAWPYLSERGVLLSDDIGWNTAFWDFSAAMRKRFVVHKSNPNFGALSRDST